METAHSAPPRRFGAWRALRAQLGSIKTRVTLAAVVCLAAGIALTTFVLVQDAERSTLAAQRERELREGVRTANLLSERVVSLQQALQKTAALLDARTLSQPRELGAFLERQPVLRGLLSNVFAATPDGRVLAFADATGVHSPALNIADREYFRRTVAEQRAIVSGALPGRVSAAPLVFLTYPLRHAAGVYGVIGGAIHLTQRDLLDDLIDEREGRSAGLVLVTDAQGRILAHPDRRRILQSIATEPQMAEGYADWLAMGGASGGAIEPSGLFLRQPGQVLSVAGVAGPDWLVWRAMPEAELLAPLHAARSKALALAAAIVAGASLLVLALIGWLLRPLTQLRHRAAHLFDGGQAPQSGWPVVGGEIGDLARVLRRVGSERARLEQLNAEVLTRLRSVMDAAPLGLLFTREGRFELVNDELCRLVGRPEHELLGQTVASSFESGEDHAKLGAQVAAAFTLGQPYVGEWRFRRGDGSSFWGQLRGRPIAAGRPEAGAIWTLADIGDHVVAREQLEWSATHDALTGLANRQLLEARLSQALEGRPHTLPAALVMIDLDHFKPINDSAGHAAGDAMLKAVAAAIAGCVRGSDLVARLGGDEFALLLQDCPPEAALRIADAVRMAIAACRVDWQGQVLQVGASLGVASLAPDTEGMTGWLHAADLACYRAKAAGRGVVRVAAAEEEAGAAA